MLGNAAPPLAGAEIDWQHVRRQQLAGACFVLALLAVLAVLTVLARNGLPQYRHNMAAGIAIGALAITLPFHLTRCFASDKERALWLGPLTILAGLIALLPTYLHGIGLWIIAIAALISVAALLRQVRMRASWAWAAILVVATIYLAFEIGGNKYVNFFADRLALFGRTDGDVFAEGAIVGSIISYGWPSMAIDGLAPLKYHVGSLWVTARLAEASGASLIPSGFVAALVASKIFVLMPLQLWAAFQAAVLFHATLRPGRIIGAACFAVTIGLLVLVAPYAGLGVANFYSETMILGAALALLVFPSAYLLASDPANSARTRHWAWAVAALALLPVSATKISMGFVLATLFGWWLLRLEGPRRLAFWLWGGVGFLAFLAAFLTFNDEKSMGATLFGKPYYVEYGFERGIWWLPVTFQIETIAALLVLACMTFARPARRLTIETLIVAAVAGNLPGLLMYIQSGNAAYFMVSQAWIAIPILAALLPAVAEAIGARLRGLHRWAPAAAVALLVLVIGYASYSEFRTRGALFIDANALLRSGDLTYYADDRRSVWRDDARRALKEFGLAKVLTMPAATPTGLHLAERLQEARRSLGAKAALYVPAGDPSYWNLVIDCDGRSLFSVAMAGLAMIDGYVPKQSDCPQEIALRGFGIPPDVRAEQSRDSICQRARDKGFERVLWLGGENAIDDVIMCGAAAQ